MTMNVIHLCGDVLALLQLCYSAKNHYCKYRAEGVSSPKASYEKKCFYLDLSMALTQVTALYLRVYARQLENQIAANQDCVKQDKLNTALKEALDDKYIIEVTHLALASLKGWKEGKEVVDIAISSIQQSVGIIAPCLNLSATVQDQLEKYALISEVCIRAIRRPYKVAKNILTMLDRSLPQSGLDLTTIPLKTTDVDFEEDYFLIPQEHKNNHVFRQFKCAITKHPLRYPVIIVKTEDKTQPLCLPLEIFERKVILNLLKSAGTSIYPHTHQPISLQNIKEHLGVRALIDQEIHRLHLDLDDFGKLHIEDFVFI